MRYGLILAGGIGSRFWPLSRQDEPKQFLNLCSRRPMLSEVINRATRLIKKDKIYIATNKIYSKKMKSCLKLVDIPSENILFEPQNKNTAAPIGVFSKLLSDFDKDALIAVLPSDHFIRDAHKFLKLLDKGFDIAREGFIVTFGVPPTRPDTGFGYISSKFVPRLGSTSLTTSRSGQEVRSSKGYYKVDRIIEKPGVLEAKRLIKDPRVFWNSGIFIFKAVTMLSQIEKFAPKIFNVLMKIRDKRDCIRLWHNFPSISIDYAVMEKTDKAVVLPCDCGWSDVGSWKSLTELMKRDKRGNTFKGRCLDMGSSNTFVWADSRLVATVGLSDVIVVDTDDALLVCRKDKAQDVKEIVSLLKERNLKTAL